MSEIANYGPKVCMPLNLPKNSDSSSFSNSSSNCWVRASIFLSASLGPACLGGVTVNCNIGFIGFFPFTSFSFELLLWGIPLSIQRKHKQIEFKSFFLFNNIEIKIFN